MLEQTINNPGAFSKSLLIDVVETAPLLGLCIIFMQLCESVAPFEGYANVPTCCLLSQQICTYSDKKDTHLSPATNVFYQHCRGSSMSPGRLFRVNLQQ